MMTLGSALARCLNCKKEVKAGQTRCACGDPVRIMTKEERMDLPHPHARTGLELLPDPVTPALALGTPRRPDRVLRNSSSDVGNVQLTPEQGSAIEAVQGWFLDGRVRDQPFRLFGPAGTGKTTLAKHLAAALGTPHIVFGAYTGKAAHVLRRKGVPATTIHSAIYRPVDNSAARARWEVACRELAEANEEYTEAASYPGGGSPDVWAPRLARKEALEAEVAELEEAIKHGVSFELNPMSEWAAADLIVLDEVSMVNEKLALDIESFGVPVLVLGDPFQLPPVEGGGHYTNHQPDVILREIHRQALESPVLALATHIRTGGNWTDQVVKVSLADAMAADQIICWKNATRHNLTAKIREKLGRPAGVPVPGDRVMCLVNNRDLNVFNGQQFEVLTANDQELHLKDDDGAQRWIWYDPDGFRGATGEQDAKARPRWRGKVGLFTFANVVTCHKAQGSEWDHVYVVDQTEQMWKSSAAEKARWAYTATTRASECVTIARTGA